ncbi:MAG TPA: hypothetical protein VII73_13795 [Caulobacteraceae bacterium]
MDAIEELRACARTAAGVGTVAGLALAGRLLVKAWELEQRAAEPAAVEGDTSLKKWAAAERARK